MLELSDLRAGYGAGPDILRGLSLELQKDSVSCIIGPNGAGKSTLLSVIAGLLRPRAGRIQFLGAEIGGLPCHEVFRRGISLVPQGRSLFPMMSVKENLLMGAYLVDDTREVARRLELVFELFPILRERQRAKAHTLSGGMQKMAEIGRGLMLRPRLMLLDEPTLGLAPKVQEQVFETIRRLKELDITVLVVEQNARRGLAASDVGIVLDLGRVVHEGPAGELLSNPQIQEWYLGSRRIAQTLGSPAGNANGRGE